MELIGRIPSWVRRCCIHAGEAPMLTLRSTPATKRPHSVGSTISTPTRPSMVSSETAIG